MKRKVAKEKQRKKKRKKKRSATGNGSSIASRPMKGWGWGFSSEIACAVSTFFKKEFLSSDPHRQQKDAALILKF